MHRPSPAVAVLAVALALAMVGMPGEASAQGTVHGRATLHVPDLLSFRMEEEVVDGESVPVVVVRANREWRLRVRSGGEELVLRGGPGRELRRVLPASVVAAAGVARVGVAEARGEGLVEVTLAPW